MSNEDRSSPISLEALRRGDRGEFARLVETHSPLVFRLGMKILNN